MLRTNWKCLLGVVCLLSVCFYASFAQQRTGSLRGQVTDELGALVVGATVTISAADGTQKTAVTSNEGTYSFNSLQPGPYTIRVVARDIPENPANQSLSGERISEPFDIDNTQPVVTASGTPQMTANGARVVFLASDKSSYLTRAEYSINGGDWMTVYADDGISDGPDERYTIDVPLSATGEYAVTLRVFDSQGNAGNARVLVRK